MSLYSELLSNFDALTSAMTDNGKMREDWKKLTTLNRSIRAAKGDEKKALRRERSELIRQNPSVTQGPYAGAAIDRWGGA